jgi:predicted O-linked N-acetylglucosamine transferase (SPINDLY family)
MLDVSGPGRPSGSGAGAEPRSGPVTAEARLVVACAKLQPSRSDEIAIRTLLAEGIDWTQFAQMLVERGLASRAGHMLLHLAPELLPDDIAGALRAVVDQTRTANDTLLTQLAHMIDAVPAAPAVERLRSAHAASDAALAANPNDSAAWRTLGQAFADLKQLKEAIACHSRAITVAPDDAAAWRNRGRARLGLRLHESALADIDQALARDHDDAAAWALRASALCPLERIAEAVEAGDRALALDPGNTAAGRALIHALLFACDWSRRGEIKRRISDPLRRGDALITPFNHLAISDSEADNFALARVWARGVPPSGEPLWRGERYRHDRIRIAYISTDFRDTLSVNAIAGGFEGHDKSRFELTAISLSPSDGSETRRRLEAAFDRFVDVQAMSDARVACMLRDQEIDIAIDLNGYAGNRRNGILAHRPAPIQVNYLGYAGTMGMSFFDYIIADRVVIPPEHHAYYSEKVVYLPDTFFPTDRKRRIAERTPSRAELGLPENGFVFTCHNTVYKISPEIFDVWMRLLRTVEGSALWLGAADALASENLRREAERRGVAPGRLVFGPWVAQRADHLARLGLADLFLDTMPYNAHTTACDALWAGLPLLTCRGNTFPARVAARLKGSIGHAELVTGSLEEYEALARDLAGDPRRLAELKAKLARNRDTAPLFDSARFTRHLEAAYVGMWERHQIGLPPESFAVV